MYKISLLCFMFTTPISSLKQSLKLYLPYISTKHYNSISSSDQKLIYLLQSCNHTLEIAQVHASMIKTGQNLEPFPLSKLLAASIIDMSYAASIFKNIVHPNLFMFNTILRGYSNSDDSTQALLLFNHMRELNIMLVDEFTFISTIKSCARVSAVGTGLGIHSVVLRRGFDSFLNLRNTLLQFYCLCGRTGDAYKSFDEFPERDAVSWSTLMSGYLRESQPAMVLVLFRRFSCDGLSGSVATLLSALSATGDLGDTLCGETLHGYSVKTGFCYNLNVVTALISMYGKSGQIESGRRVFDEAILKDVVIWNCIIDGYAKSGLLEESLALLKLMKLKKVKPNTSTLAGLLSACASNGALNVGQHIHSYIDEEQLELDTRLGTALVNMYSKCGFLTKAVSIFNKMKTKDVKTWTAMILGFGFNGQAKNAMDLFHQMEEKECQPNEVTFLAVFSACSHGGLVSEGVRVLQRMVKHYGLKPKVEHYGCIVDLLGRAGLLKEAHDLLKNDLSSIEVDATAWRTLLAACRVHGDIDLAESVKRTLEEKYGEQHPADSMVIASMYAVVGRMQGVTNKEVNCDQSTKVKNAGYSSIELAAANGRFNEYWRVKMELIYI